MQDYSGYGYGPDYGSTSPLPPMPPQPPRRRVGLLSYVAVALVAGALGAGSVVALYHPAASSTTVRPSSTNPPVALPSTAVPTPSSGGSGSAAGEPDQGRPGRHDHQHHAAVQQRAGGRHRHGDQRRPTAWC